MVRLVVEDRDRHHANAVPQKECFPPITRKDVRAQWAKGDRPQQIAQALRAKRPAEDHTAPPRNAQIRDFCSALNRAGKTARTSSAEQRTLNQFEQLVRIARDALGPEADRDAARAGQTRHSGQMLWLHPGDSGVQLDDWTGNGVTAFLYMLDIADFHASFQASERHTAPTVLSADGKVKMVDGFTVIALGLVMPVQPPAHREGQPHTHRLYPLAILVTNREVRWVYTRALDAIENARRCPTAGCDLPMIFHERSNSGYECGRGCAPPRAAPVQPRCSCTVRTSS